jgi:hypothetical protein
MKYTFFSLPPPDVAASPDAVAPISVMTSDKRVYSKKVIDTIDFSVPPPGLVPPGIPPPGLPPRG